MSVAETHLEESFLPDFCSVRVVFSGVVLGLLLTSLLLLSPLGRPGYQWESWALLALFIQWAVLVCGGALCLARPWLERLREVWAGLLSWLLVLGLTAVLLEMAWNWVILPTALPEHLPRMQHSLFLFRNLGIAAVVGAVALRYLYVSHHWQLRRNAELSARMQALQSRINPHFLFNTMNSIASLTRVDPALAERAIEDLSDLLRASLGDASRPLSLCQEVELCHKYIEIERLRLGDRLNLQWELEWVPQDALIPGLSLQTLLENAVRHGIESLPEGGTIKLSGISDGACIRLDIENPLHASSGARPGHRLALDNLRQRFHAYYGPEAHLRVERTATTYRVGLRFPYRPAPPEDPGAVPQTAKPR